MIETLTPTQELPAYVFQPWPKISRLNRRTIVTEKIDGTNAAVWISPDGTEVRAQSRTRQITPDDDNHRFARWVYDNAGALADDLGPGYHFGEWWGVGIQRGYGLSRRYFSLFNTERWRHKPFTLDGLAIVPELAVLNTFDSEGIGDELNRLRTKGSVAAPGFMRPEGIVVLHVPSRTVMKALLEGDDQPKGLQA